MGTNRASQKNFSPEAFRKLNEKSNYTVLVLFKDEMRTPTSSCAHTHTDLNPISTFFESCICLSFGDQRVFPPSSNNSIWFYFAEVEILEKRLLDYILLIFSFCKLGGIIARWFQGVKHNLSSSQAQWKESNEQKDPKRKFQSSSAPKSYCPGEGLCQQRGNEI